MHGSIHLTFDVYIPLERVLSSAVDDAHVAEKILAVSVIPFDAVFSRF